MVEGNGRGGDEGGGVAQGFSQVTDPEKRAFLIALSELGVKRYACEAARVTAQRVASWCRSDPEFAELYREAEQLGADALIKEARRRATEGVREYQFNSRGDPLRHPELCICEHHVLRHRRSVVPVEAQDAKTRSKKVREGVGDNLVVFGSCSDCDCEAFVGQPYYVDKRSDLLLMFTIKGVRPEYKDQAKVQVGVFQIDPDFARQLPDDALDRLARGEPVAQVLAGMKALPPSKAEGR